MWHRFKMSMGRFLYGLPKTKKVLTVSSLFAFISFGVICVSTAGNLTYGFWPIIIFFFCSIFFAVSYFFLGLSDFVWRKELPEYKIEKAKEKLEKIASEDPDLANKLEDLITLADGSGDIRILETWLALFDKVNFLQDFELENLKKRQLAIPEEVNKLNDRWKEIPSEIQKIQKDIDDKRRDLLSGNGFL